jgi:two-component system chemotaxis sensor kinase CheA
MERDRSDVLEYLIEASESLELIEKNLLLYEKSVQNGSLADKDILDTLFRHFHTIKGSSGFFGLTGIVKVAHAAENLLDFLRVYPELQDEETLDLLIQTKDILQELVSSEEKNSTDGDLQNQTQWDLLANLNKKNESVRLSQKEIRPLTKVTNEDFGLFSEESPKETIESNDEFGLFSVEKPIAVEEEFGLFLPTTPKKENVKQSQAAPTTKHITKKDIRIDTAKLDSLLDIVGEIVISEPMVTNHPEIKNLKLEQFNKSTLHLKKLVRSLQEITLSLRMVPIDGVFSKMERLVRDTAKRTGKQVQLIIEGEETEIDKSIVEEIYDPLVHILRNAIDHGLETPEERKEAGKQPTGKITLSALQSGKEVWIRVNDDGKGLSRDKVLKKAIERGMTHAHNVDLLSDRDIWEFLFQPGFSTADEVTDLSGRGVGLDVVKKNVTELNGFIDITSIYGQGTTFLIRVPLTLAIIEGMVVKRKDGYFILPSIDIKETIYVTNDKFSELYENNHMIQFRGNLIPLVDLELLFDRKSSLNDVTELINSYVVVTESQDKQMGIVFDDIIGNQSIVIKPISPVFKNINGLAGCTILGNGQAGLILDVRKLMANHLTMESL